MIGWDAVVEMEMKELLQKIAVGQFLSREKKRLVGLTAKFGEWLV